VPRERSDSPLIVTSMPASQGRMRSEFASVTSIVVITDPDHSPESIDKVASAFGVTTAEAAVALGLVQGDDAATIARKRGVSLNTVRTLRSRAYQKIGVRSQGALVKILGALS
jgi:DNA-binding CsgD family transcriptional regulator